MALRDHNDWTVLIDGSPIRILRLREGRGRLPDQIELEIDTIRDEGALFDRFGRQGTRFALAIEHGGTRTTLNNCLVLSSTCLELGPILAAISSFRIVSSECWTGNHGSNALLNLEP